MVVGGRRRRTQTKEKEEKIRDDALERRIDRRIDRLDRTDAAGDHP